MKFADLPVGTKFLDDIELAFEDREEMIKVSDTHWDYVSMLTDNMPVCWTTEYKDNEIYPVLEWED